MRWFPTILFAVVVVCAIIWLYDRFVLAPKRRKSHDELVAKLKGLEDSEDGAKAKALDAAQAVLEPPKVVDFAKSFLPVFLAVFVLRSFVVEPFRIPSASMMPTLVIGDLILVNKFTYGIRLPTTDQKVVELGKPERGDVVVFRYPNNPATPYIKRVVGLPGDKIAYRNKQLFINGDAVPQQSVGQYRGFGSGLPYTGYSLNTEALPNQPHDILVNPVGLSGNGQWVVPEGQYFVLGDNRDNSRDSRFWGFVPDENLIGKAFVIWMSLDFGHGVNWNRIGNSID